MDILALALLFLGGMLAGALLVAHVGLRTRTVRTTQVVRTIERSAEGFARTAQGGRPTGPPGGRPLPRT